jgi:ADP-ribosylglycohydrolase
MALGLLLALHHDGGIDPDHLALVLGRTYLADPARGYGYGMHQLLPVLREEPASWSTAARELFEGQGSLGNGAAMRAAPLGAWFHDDLDRAVAQGAVAARVTHQHPEGVAGGVAVTAAAALAAALRTPGNRTADGAVPRTEPNPDPNADPVGFLLRIADLTPPSRVRDGLRQAAELPADAAPWQAADLLGSGQRIRADDTVPFAVWSAAHHLDSLTDALWCTAEGLGDVDTTCAITGGIVGARTGTAGVPDTWLTRREPLPTWVDTPDPDQEPDQSAR